MSYYPTPVNERSRSPKHTGAIDGANAVGSAATFVCGSYIRFSLRVNQEEKQVIAAAYRTNGCGYMIATAETIAEALTNRFLVELHSLDHNWLNSLVEADLGPFEKDRQHCKDACIEAVQSAFFDYRALQIEEFQGEKALICTCFGVTEETIAALVSCEMVSSVERVGQLCNAGSGCGSCRMLIQEMIDQQGGSGTIVD